MTSSDSASYFITLVAITLAPGPVALMLIARSASRDLHGACSFGIGFSFGGVIIISIVYFGFGSFLTDGPEVLAYSKYLMFGYVLWLAYGMWNAGFEIENSAYTARKSGSALCAGMLTCFISPYMTLLFPLVLPGIMEVSEFKVSQFVLIIVMTFVALVTGCLLLISCSSQLSRIARSPQSTLFLNRSLATVLALGGGWLGFT